MAFGKCVCVCVCVCVRACVRVCGHDSEEKSCDILVMSAMIALTLHLLYLHYNILYIV